MFKEHDHHFVIALDGGGHKRGLALFRRRIWICMSLEQQPCDRHVTFLNYPEQCSSASSVGGVDISMTTKKSSNQLRLIQDHSPY